ncbi:MAG: hypothetical protein V3W04_15815 [Gammaproteobacteria bacterium]
MSGKFTYNCHGVHWTNGSTHPATIAAVSINAGTALVFSVDGLVITAVVAGHADDIVPGNADRLVQDSCADDGFDSRSYRDINGACSNAVLAKGAATLAEVEVGNAGLFVI